MTGANEVPLAVTNAVGMSVGSSTLVIQANDDGTGGTVWYNDEIVTVGSGLDLATEVTFYQRSQTQYVLMCSTDFYITMDLKKSHIDLFVNAKMSVCSTAQGLLGLCDSDSTNDFKMSDENTLLESDGTHELTLKNIEDSFVPSWESDDEIFTDIIPGFNGGSCSSCLRIQSSSLVSEEVSYFTESEITVDIIFYLESVPTECGTLWSYKNAGDNIFAVLVCQQYIYYYSTLNPSETITPVNIKVDITKWYQLSVVWTRFDETLYFYLIDDSYSFVNEYATDSSIKDLLTPGGTFMLGLTHSNLYGFEGYVDDFTVWKSSFTLNDIVTRAFQYIDSSSESNLAYIWRFNEGNGYSAKDSTERLVKFNWLSGGWEKIHWSVCAYQVTYPSFEEVKDVLISDPLPEDVRTCESLINSVPQIDTLTDSSRHQYLEECLMLKVISEDQESGSEILTPISDTIEPNRTADAYPLKELCNNISGPTDWYGQNCNIYCVFGAGDFSTKDDQCICKEGYYGYSCEHTCPYARGEPCGGGTCNSVTGACTCSSERFDPSNKCRTCASGWVGEDCSSVAAVIPEYLPKYTAVCFGQGHCTMFDGQAFNIRTPGQYILFKKVSSLLSIFIRMKPCAGCKVCIQQVWFSMTSDDFTVKAPLTENGPVIMEHNSESVSILSLASYSINSEATITWIDKVTLQFVFEDAVTVDVSYIASSSYLSVNVKTSCSDGDQTGLLGNCNQNVDDDFVDSSGNDIPYSEISDHIINDQFSSYFTKETLVDNHFIYSYPDLNVEEPENMMQGYSLLLNGSGAMSGRVPEDSFLEGQNFNVSLEVKIQLLSESGLILGYYKSDSENQFSLYLNSSKLEIYFYGTVFKTDAVLSYNIWYHIIVTLDGPHMKLFIYSNKELEFNKNFDILQGYFPPSGNFFIGEWSINPPIRFGTFFGLYGQLRVWNIYLEEKKIFQLVNDADVKDLEGLVMDYQFTEGFGDVTYDLKQNIGMTMTTTDYQIAWILSDKPGLALNNNRCSFSNYADRTEKCEKMFATQSVTTACNGLGTDFSTFYIDACKSDDSYVPAIVSFIVVCETLIDPSTDPIDDLCYDHKADHYDSFCGHFCIQGTPTDVGCECYPGFWDWNCARECPDRIGVGNLPCFANGACDVSNGNCICKQGFSQQFNCKNCTEPFKGEHCNKFEIIPPSKGNSEPDNETSSGNETNSSEGGSSDVKSICQIFGTLKVKTFSGEAYTIATANEWGLINPLNDSFTEIKGRTVKCGRNICLKSIHIRHKTEEIIVEEKGDKTQRIKVNGQNDPSASSFFKYIEKSDSVVVLSGKKWNIGYFFKLRLRFKDKGYLTLTVITDCEACKGLSVCSQNSSFISSYDPIDFTTFSSITVDESDKTLPETFVEPNTEAGYSLKFESDLESISVTGEGTGMEDILDSDLSTNRSKTTVSASGDKFTVISTGILKGLFSPDEKNVLKFSIKPDKESSGGLFQYVGESTFIVYLNNNTINVQADSKIINTGIVLPANEWRDVEINFEHVGETMTVDVTGLENGLHETKVFTVSKDIFADNGQIVMGKPKGSFNKNLGIPTDGSCSGEIDDLKVYTGDNEDLTLHLTFDEGEGKEIVDSSAWTNNFNIYDPYHKGNVTRSISSKPSPEIETDVNTGFLDEISYINAKNKCREILSNAYIATKCSGLGNVTGAVYESVCVDDIARHGMDTSDAVDSPFSFTDYCFYQLIETADDVNDTQELEEDPSKYLCQYNFGTAGYVGENCDIPCVHPDPHGEGLECICETGYWGIACEEECPGGFENVCSGHGDCDTNSGQCTCRANFQGSDCSMCNANWHGTDCQVQIQDESSESSTYSAFIASNSHMKTFDGAFLNFNNKDKPCDLYSDGTVKVEALMGTSSKYTSSVKALSISVEDQLVTIYPQDDGKVKLNGEEVSLGTVNLPAGYEVKKLSLTEIVVTGPNKFEMKCLVGAQDNIGVQMSMSKSGCKESTGVLGKCSTGDASNCDPADSKCILSEVGISEGVKNFDISTSDLDAYFADLGKNYKDTVFAEMGEKQVTSGTGILLSEGAYVSLPVLDEDMIDENSTEKSLEMRVKYQTVAEGTILSVANTNTTFGLVIKNGKYAVQFGEDIYSTNIPVTVGQWTNLGIALNDTSGELLFHEKHETSYGQYKLINMSDSIYKYGSPFIEGSTMVLGKWQNTTTELKTSGPGSSDSFPNFLTDRVLLYNGLNTINDFNDHFAQNYNKKQPLQSTISENSADVGLTFDPLTSKSLALVMNFDEASGNQVTDDIRGKTGFIGFEGIYQWDVSDPPIADLSIPNQHDFPVNYPNAMCEKLKNAFTEQCDQATTNFFYQACLQDTLTTGNKDDSIDVSLTFGDVCRDNSGRRPTDGLCNEFGGRQYPTIGGDDCSQRCSFGEFENGVCKCAEGYYGAECKFECPGGHKSPCSNHGKCDTSTGECFCEIEWSGDNLCSSCHKDWTGENCNIQKTDPTADVDEVGNDEDYNDGSEPFNGTTPVSIDDNKGMKCVSIGKNGKVRMFKGVAKKLKKVFNKAVLLEIEHLRILVS